ncbi:MAG: hypothetical protein QF733_09805 [Phycisphaerales bacterium]|nr:hypothetical protein [Phycisphaerales bacterium]
MFTRFLATAVLIGASGCGSAEPDPAADKVQATVTPSTGLFVADRPDDAPGVTEAKAAAKVGAPIRFLARVGGRPEPFITGTAVFVAADPSLLSCELMGEEDHCAVPWDYCCEDSTALRDGMVTVRLIDEHGDILRSTAEGMGGLEASKFILVDGVVHDRNDDGLLIVDASQIWVGGAPTRADPMLGSR